MCISLNQCKSSPHRDDKSRENTDLPARRAEAPPVASFEAREAKDTDDAGVRTGQSFQPLLFGERAIRRSTSFPTLTSTVASA